jgi:hypothetical protein
VYKNQKERHMKKALTFVSLLGLVASAGVVVVASTKAAEKALNGPHLFIGS